MKRRDLIKAIAGTAAAWPLNLRAQQPGRMRRIGILAIGDIKNGAYVAALRDALMRLGWIDGKNVHLELRFTRGRPDLIKEYAAELVSIRSDVIVCVGTANLIALKEETQTVPIVFIMVSDPVGAGHIASFARPGGNLTGFTPFEPSLGGKWVELLTEGDPRVKRIALLFSPSAAANAPSFVQTAKVAGKSLSVSVSSMLVRDDSEIERAITAFSLQPGGAVAILPDSFPISHRKKIIAVTSRHHLPLIAPFYPIVKGGALMSYGVNIIDEFRRAAGYVDRILRGEKPVDLPVQFPLKYRFVINLKTAEKLGIVVPASLLARADEVIE